MPPLSAAVRQECVKVIKDYEQILKTLRLLKHFTGDKWIVNVLQELVSTASS